MVIFNVVLMAAMILAIAGALAWAVVTQHRDHAVVSAGRPLGRRVWSRSRRAYAGSQRPLYVRPPYRAHPWPAA
jgi:hypothetical protein